MDYNSSSLHHQFSCKLMPSAKPKSHICYTSTPMLISISISYDYTAVINHLRISQLRTTNFFSVSHYMSITSRIVALIPIIIVLTIGCRLIEELPSETLPTAKRKMAYSGSETFCLKVAHLTSFLYSHTLEFNMISRYNPIMKQSQILVENVTTYH